ncbi:glutaminyl-peptide cyclotransferase-like protein, partial [Coturnix japonica]|uniref:glutaminyl-peptide cyclotransferase-like protein n=1 Tax=Coturnix japonica TaxID=93934 RepID=UPI0007773BD7
SILSSLGWHLDLDTFTSPTPRGAVTFTNLVATSSPPAPHRLVLACHYDTKILPAPQVTPFIGAVDSAVPCAIMMEVAAALDGALRRYNEGDPQVTLQLLFLDGEEAFEEWSPTDSIYGARHLAAKMAATPHGTHGTQLSAMPVLHLIPLPFPWVWHTVDDTQDNLHPPTIEDLCKILIAFVAEYLQL